MGAPELRDGYRDGLKDGYTQGVQAERERIRVALQLCEAALLMGPRVTGVLPPAPESARLMALMQTVVVGEPKGGG